MLVPLAVENLCRQLNDGSKLVSLDASNVISVVSNTGSIFYFIFFISNTWSQVNLLEVHYAKSEHKYGIGCAANSI